MATFKQPPKPNPLMQYMRQPKIYLKLPSNGAFWDNGTIEIPENGELPVYSMTAKDELLFKTPDALMNGQGIVDVIQSCIPAIKNAWATPNLDLDVILIAIRLATYGPDLEISYKVPVIDEPEERTVNLTTLLDSIYANTKWDEEVVVNENITCYIRPLTYKHMTKTSIKTFETQRLMQVINDDAVSDEQKLEVFNKSMGTMTEITVDLIADSIYTIKTPEVTVEDPNFIKEFVKNADKDIFDKINARITSLKDVNGLQPLKVQSSPEQIEAGAPAEFEVPIGFDNASFFGKSS
jgi:hypothetical protein